MLFVFDRETGEPVFEVVERPVPQSDVAGEVTSPTQPFPATPPLASHAAVTPQDAWGLTFYDRGKCRELISRYRSEGIFTPPSLQGTIHVAGFRRRRQLGQHGIRQRASARDRRGQPCPDGRDARAARPVRHGAALGRMAGLGVRSADRHALRHAPRNARLAVRPALHGAALGNARGRRSASQRHSLAGDARLDPRHDAVVHTVADAGDAEHGRADRHGRADSRSSAPRWTITCAPSTSTPAASSGKAGCPRAARRHR